MDAIARFLHLIGAVTRLGGIDVMPYASRPVALAQLLPLAQPRLLPHLPR